MEGLLMALASVIIPTFNRADKVVRAISSVLYQTFSDYEIIVVDDGSYDQTQEALSRFEGRIVYIRHPINLGVSAARNTGIRGSTGLFICFLDSDDYWLPEKIAVQLDFFSKHPSAVICQTEDRWIRNGRRVNPREKHRKPSGDIFLPSLRLCLVSPSAVMLKRNLLEEVGLFDESLPACEDYDLWLRIACRYPIHLIKTPLVIKEGGNPDQLSMRYKGMDRFRIKALARLISTGSLSEEQVTATLRELTTKCQIYAKGCLKRGKTSEALFYLELPQELGQDSFNRFSP
jgi:glycosyltransferase involved in cell wall biosynthesis